MSVGLCGNTEEGYTEHHAGAEQSGELTKSYEAYLGWDTAEWWYELFDGDHSDTFNNELSVDPENLEDSFGAYFEHLIETMTYALAELRVERARELDGVILFVTITDSEETEAVEERSVKRLNPPAIVETFMRRFG